MIDIDEHFEKGTAVYEYASQAIDQLNAARAAGLNEQADRLEDSFLQSIISLRKTNGTDPSGFNAVRQSIGELTPVIEQQRKSQINFQTAESRIDAVLNQAGAAGANVPNEVLKAVRIAKLNKNAEALDSYAEGIEETNKIFLTEKSKSQPKEQVSLATLNPFEQERLSSLAAMKKIDPNQIADPAVFNELAQEVKKREAVETQARKIFRRLQAARELYASPELMNEFGDTKPTQWTQTLFTTGDNALHAALLGQLKGGDLAQGMAEVKAATGTSAGMAVEETKALANSISALGPDLPPEAAQKKLKQVIDDAKFALERLGVDQELIKNKTSGDDVLANKTKYLLPDERKFHLGVSGSSTGNSSSGISTSTERLRAITPQINQSPRTRITGE